LPVSDLRGCLVTEGTLCVSATSDLLRYARFDDPGVLTSFFWEHRSVADRFLNNAMTCLYEDQPVPAATKRVLADFLLGLLLSTKPGSLDVGGSRMNVFCQYLAPLVPDGYITFLRLVFPTVCLSFAPICCATLTPVPVWVRAKRLPFG
jgi:hypothetical protein